MQKNELRACPFCGGEDVRYEHRGKDYHSHVVACHECGAITDYFSTEHYAVAAWNHRADGWRPASEPPKTNAGERPKSVMVCAVHPDGRARLHTGWCMEGRWYVPWVEVEAVVTHWRHLPEPPKEEDDG